MSVRRTTVIVVGRARVDMQLADGVQEGDVERWAQSASVLHSNGDAMDIAVCDERIVGGRGQDDRVNRGRLGSGGSVWLAGEQLARSLDVAGGCARRAVGRERLEHGDGTVGRAFEAAAVGSGRAGHFGFYRRPASCSGGVLHAGGALGRPAFQCRPSHSTPSV